MYDVTISVPVVSPAVIPYIIETFVGSSLVHVIVTESVSASLLRELIIGGLDSLNEKFRVDEKPVSSLSVEMQETFHL